jgi:transcriptional regulator with XRE-family HTH domain
MIRRMEKLRAWLESNATSQSAFADAIGVKQPTVSDWLNGRMSPSAANLRKIAGHTGLSFDELLAPSTNSSSAPNHAAA